MMKINIKDIRSECISKGLVGLDFLEFWWVSGVGKWLEYLSVHESLLSSLDLDPVVGASDNLLLNFEWVEIHQLCS